MVEVKYLDHLGYEKIIQCEDKYQAERMIEAELITAKMYTFEKQNIEYDYADFSNEDGHLVTEIWEETNDLDNRIWIKWERMW